MKLDGDIELKPDYFRELIERFAADPALGLAGGVLDEPTADGGFRRIQIPRVHVHGALKLYSRECFEAIGGVQERLGWDTIDETYARMRGFTAWSFPDLVSIHHRPLGSADGTVRGHARHGECAYIAHFTAVLGRAARGQGRHAGARAVLSGARLLLRLRPGRRPARRAGPRPGVPPVHTHGAAPADARRGRATSPGSEMSVGIVGLGYVGLPLAMEFAEAGIDVIGVDVDAQKVAGLRARPLAHRGRAGRAPRRACSSAAASARASSTCTTPRPS